MKTAHQYLTIVGVVFLTALSCSFRTVSENEVFRDLSYIMIAKDFPTSKKEIENCGTNPGTACQLYKIACKAKASLLKNGKDAAFSRTMAALTAYCPCLTNTLTNTETNTEATLDTRCDLCIGAVEALYFFTSKSDDEALLSFFTARPALLFAIMKIRNFAFFYNRADTVRWKTTTNAAIMAIDSTALYIDPYSPNAIRGHDPVVLLE